MKLDKLLNQYNEERVKVAVIEEELKMPDYRILVFDDEVVKMPMRDDLFLLRVME